MKAQRNQITFAEGRDAAALALAKFGLSNRSIRRRTGLSESQINYRLHKAKVAENNAGGYRVEWRSGKSPLAQEILNDYLGIVLSEVKKTMPPRFVHKTPEIVKTP